MMAVRRTEGRTDSVEMTKPDGRLRIIPDFRDEAEANAWIIQTQRMIDAAHPHIFGLPRRVPDAPASGPRAKKGGHFGGAPSSGFRGGRVQKTAAHSVPHCCGARPSRSVIRIQARFAAQHFADCLTRRFLAHS